MQMKRTALVTVAAVILAIFGQAGTASAAPEPNETNATVMSVHDRSVLHLTDLARQLVRAPEIADGREDLIDLAYEAARSTGTHLTNQDAFATGQESAHRLSDGTTVVGLPVASQTMARAWVSVITSPNGIVHVTEIRVREHGINAGYIQMWNDGRLVLNAIVVPAAEPDLDWSKLKKCLANAGVSAGVLATIAVVCEVACFVTVGIGCVVCIAGAVGFGGGVVASCVKDAS